MRNCRKINRLLLFLLPIVVFFTNFPILKLGETDSMHLEISLPEIWLVLFALTSLPNLKSLVKFFKPKRLVFISLLPLYAFISTFWSGNPLRTILTSGLLTLIIFAILNTLYLLKAPTALAAQGVLRHKLLQVFLVTSVVVSLFCWLQCLLDLLDVSRADSLMCAGCTYESFGFPHPNGFTLEPQFMGGLLIAPALTSFYLAVAKIDQEFICRNKAHRRIYLLLAFFFSTTLFLTFSRGAIYSFAIATVFLTASLIIVNFKSAQKPAKISREFAPLLILPTIVAASLVSLAAQGTMAALSPTSDDFVSGTTKAIHHLTLGHLDLRPVADEPDASSQQASVSQETAPSSSPQQSTYSGYVSESTDIRVNFANLALKAATKNPATLIFGSGLGSAGTTLNKEFPDKVGTPKQIVQNEYASLLLELGILGIVLVLAIIAISCKKLNILIYSILLGYAGTLFFFSGLPNAFHIYLIPPLLASIFSADRVLVAKRGKSLAKPLVRRTRRKQ